MKPMPDEKRAARYARSLMRDATMLSVTKDGSPLGEWISVWLSHQDGNGRASHVAKVRTMGEAKAIEQALARGLDGLLQSAYLMGVQGYSADVAERVLNRAAKDTVVMTSKPISAHDADWSSVWVGGDVIGISRSKAESSQQARELVSAAASLLKVAYAHGAAGARRR